MTYAALNAQMGASNVISMGTVKISLKDEIQTMASESGEIQWEEFPESTHIFPGARMTKRLTVTNVGRNACYIRVKVVPQVSGDGQPARVEDDITFTYDGSAWVPDGDGYYRYEGILQPNESAALEGDIQFHQNIGNDGKDARFSIDNRAQGVQSQNNEHIDVLNVVGWPTA